MSTKHSHRSSLPTSEEHAVPLRRVPAPHRVSKGERETDAVVLGSQEPPEGRYSTVVRQSFGSSDANRQEARALDAQRRQRSMAMNQKNFPFGYEGVALPIISEAQGAQQSAVDELRRQRSQGYTSESPAPYTSADRSSGRTTPALAAKLEIQAHMERMRSSNVFSAAPSPVPTSTQRGSYASHDATGMAKQREDAARLRRIQTQTSWCTGHERGDWKSVKESTMDGRAGVPAKLSTQNLATCINIGSETVSKKDTLKSLKQVDFVPHRASPTPPPAFSAHEDHLVLGYRPRDVNSTNRVSYTPTMFVRGD
uniref:Uncharacterized protein n=2 Tax=Neobodo designis TaxID=312471 RepID=A0A7S1KZY9_NEODS|mmetsp:Transcript_12188/g.37934  ORF Transcript_12188/g.37934 Transcript_12188/m.37934 type:complete len:311 (+) Transcript_12188:42-974(+)